MLSLRRWLWPWVCAGCLTAGGAVRLAWGAQDVMVFYEVAPADGGEKPNVDIHLRRLTANGQVQLGTGPEGVALADSTNIETSPAACSDGIGGAIVAYCYEFTTGDHEGDADVVAQRVDADGHPLWNGGASPQPVFSSKGREDHPVVVSDGEHGAFVVCEWTDTKNGKADTDLLVQRIDGDGKRLWNEGTKPMVVASSVGLERHPVVVPDGQGGVIVVFEWEGEDGDIDVMANRISADGQCLWETNNQPLDVCATKNLERRPVVVPDGQGGVIVVFEIEFVEGDNKGDVDIMAQRVSAEGKLLWGGDRAAVEVSSSKYSERNPCAVPDGAGGVIAAFEVTPREGERAGDTDLYAQRLDGEGKMLWNEGKRSIPVSASVDRERGVRAVSTSDGGALLVFETAWRLRGPDGDVVLMAQRVDAQGSLKWQDGPNAVSLSDFGWLERAPLVLPDGEDGAFVLYQATCAAWESGGDEDIWAMRVSDEGRPMWSESERPVTVARTKNLERNFCGVLVPER